MLKYVFPPRPENKVNPNSLNVYENKGMFAQVKANGSCGVLLLDSPTSHKLYNRHNEILTNVKIDRTELNALHHGTGGMVVVGEYLNKNQKHINLKQEFNHKFLIHDVIVYGDDHLIGNTCTVRQNMIDDMYRAKAVDFDPFLLQLSENVFVMKNFDTGFQALYNEASQIDVYEGLVLKRKTARLEAGTREKNNTLWQIKARKPTKNYTY